MTYRCAITIGRESTYGTAVVTNRELAVIGEGFEAADNDVDGEGFYAGDEGPRDTGVTRPVLGGSGSLSLQPTSKGLGLMVEEIMGAAATHTSVSAGIYQTLAVFGDTYPSITLQKQLPIARTGSLAVQQYKGCVVTGFDLTMDAKGVLQLAVNYDVRDPYGTASADALARVFGTRFSFAGAKSFSGTITAPTATALATGSTPLAGVRSFKVTVDHKLATDDPYNMNNGGLKDKPMPNELRTVEVELTRELVDESFETALRNGTSMGLVLTFEAESLGASNACLQVVLPSVRPKGPMPKVGQDMVLTTPYRLVAYKTAAFAQRMWLILRTSDVALA
jgi:hypothetical protein